MGYVPPSCESAMIAAAAANCLLPFPTLSLAMGADGGLHCPWQTKDLSVTAWKCRSQVVAACWTHGVKYFAAIDCD